VNTHRETVAVVGTGRMGTAMTGRLRSGGADVIVYNRTRERAEKAASQTGADVADTAREAASSAGTVIVSLADDRAVDEAYTGNEGIIAGLNPGTVVADTSTIDPETARRIAHLVEEAGAGHLDSPVSGSVSVVERGELTIMAGGRGDDLDAARPVLDVLATRIFHMGDHGTGAAMKLAVNAVVGALNLAVAEALVLAERAGIERSTAYEVFASSVVAAPYVLYKREAFEQPEETPVAFSLNLVAKDLDLILELARRVGASMDQAAANREAVRRALAAGFGDADISAIAEYLRQQK
jgi:3-hydroxyisobutyrate dehydrogenase-like beta-hydroxyacid dehydrogenase